MITICLKGAPCAHRLTAAILGVESNGTRGAPYKKRVVFQIGDTDHMTAQIIVIGGGTILSYGLSLDRLRPGPAIRVEGKLGSLCHRRANRPVFGDAIAELNE